MNKDTISRQAAIDALTHFTNLSWDELKMIYPMFTVIEELPSAERHGRWEWNNDEFFYSCSNCGHKAYGNTSEIVSGLYAYCPNCGASMDEVEDGE